MYVGNTAWRVTEDKTNNVTVTQSSHALRGGAAEVMDIDSQKAQSWARAIPGHLRSRCRECTALALRWEKELGIAADIAR